MKYLKERLQAGEAVHGTWLNSGAAINAELVGKAGFDWVLIDLEHGAGTENNLLDQLRALGCSNSVPIVRVEALVRQRVSRLLDMGAEGILFPQIQNASEAADAVAFMRYPPEGRRGMAYMVRAMEFGQKFEDYYEVKRHQIPCIVQIETIGALEQLDEIAQTDGVDVLFVGPADLTLALGIFRQFDHPMYIDVLERVNAAAEKAGKATGILMTGPHEYAKYHELGFRMLASGADSTYVLRGAKDLAAEMGRLRDQA